MTSSSSLPDNVFRANVGAVIANEAGEVLALERLKIKGAWQLPQGGLDEGEEPIDAVKREVHEETGITDKHLELLAEYPEWLAYELDRDKRTGKHGRGQVQKWFLFRFKGTDSDINLKSDDEQEFSSWKWMDMRQLAQETVQFRQKIYQKLAEGFREYLKQ
jgi:putative (di)nucleoside polyphosphate hydrolase